MKYYVSVGKLDLGQRVKELIDGHGDETTSGSANKRLPEWYQFAGRDFILGVVNGLVATDGTVTVSNAKGKPQLMVAFSSTSFRLVREFKRCCQLLGVGSTITFSRHTMAGNASWICSVSTVDAKRVGLLDRCCNTRKRDLFASAEVSGSAMCVRNDILPFPGGVAERLIPLVPAAKTSGVDWSKLNPDEADRRRRFMAIAVNIRARASEGTITRDLVRRIVELGDEIAERNLANFSECSSVLAGIESRFAPMLADDDGGSRRSWKVPVSLDEVKTMSLGLEAVKPRFCGTWQDDVHCAVVAFAQMRKKGFITWAQLGQVRDVLSKFNGPNSELRDSEDLKALSMMEKSEVSWARVRSVEKTGKVELGYDLTVPGTDTFLSDDGVVLSNTVNIHVPSSDKAVKQALEKMMPSENLVSLTDLSSPRHPPSKEQIFGLYAATSRVEDKPPKVFNTVSEAKQAYARGEIGMNDPIEILHA